MFIWHGTRNLAGAGMQKQQPFQKSSAGVVVCVRLEVSLYLYTNSFWY